MTIAKWIGFLRMGGIDKIYVGHKYVKLTINKKKKKCIILFDPCAKFL